MKVPLSSRNLLCASSHGEIVDKDAEEFPNGTRVMELRTNLVHDIVQHLKMQTINKIGIFGTRNMFFSKICISMKNFYLFYRSYPKIIPIGAGSLSGEQSTIGK